MVSVDVGTRASLQLNSTTSTILEVIDQLHLDADVQAVVDDLIDILDIEVGLGEATGFQAATEIIVTLKQLVEKMFDQADSGIPLEKQFENAQKLARASLVLLAKAREPSLPPPSTPAA